MRMVQRPLQMASKGWFKSATQQNLPLAWPIYKVVVSRDGLNQPQMPLEASYHPFYLFLSKFFLLCPNK